MSVVIEIRGTGRPPEVREFPQTKITIGRTVGNIILGDPQASARHAELTITTRGVTYVDLKSTNGSFLESGERIHLPLVWAPGSVIRIGSSTLRLVRFGVPDFGPSGTLMVAAEAKPVESALAPPVTPIVARPSPVAGTPAPFANDVLAVASFTPLTDKRVEAGQAATEEPRAASPFTAGASEREGMDVAIGVTSLSAGGSVERAAPPLDALESFPDVEVQDLPFDASEKQRAVSPTPATVTPTLFGFFGQSLRAYDGHWLEGWKVVGVLALPLALLSGATGYNEWLDLLAPPVTSLAYAVVFFLFGLGAQAEFALRLFAGVPVGASGARRIHLQRMIPWLVELLPPLMMTGLGCVFTLLAFGPLLLPVYMIERTGGFRVNIRSVDLLARGFTRALIPLSLVTGFLGAFLVAGTLALQRVPVLGSFASALFGPMLIALVMPFMAFLQFRAYAEIRRRGEGLDVPELVRATLNTPFAPS
jgi:FHA domain